jgi:protocatechuate 3,4-dioxygenase, beta subunit
MKGREMWTTQSYVKGEEQNEPDGVFRNIKDAKARESVTVAFAPVEGSPLGEVAARFDIVMGFTPQA